MPLGTMDANDEVRDLKLEGRRQEERKHAGGFLFLLVVYLGHVSGRRAEERERELHIALHTALRSEVEGEDEEEGEREGEGGE